MKTRFLVKKAFVLEARPSYVICGKIMSGVVEKNMKAALASDLVVSVDSFGLIKDSEDDDLIGLVIKYHDEEELQRLRNLKLAGTQILLWMNG